MYFCLKATYLSFKISEESFTYGIFLCYWRHPLRSEYYNLHRFVNHIFPVLKLKFSWIKVNGTAKSIIVIIAAINYFTCPLVLYCFICRNSKLRHISALISSSSNSCTTIPNRLSNHLKLRIHMEYVYF